MREVSIQRRCHDAAITLYYLDRRMIGGIGVSGGEAVYHPPYLPKSIPFTEWRMSGTAAEAEMRLFAYLETQGLHIQSVETITQTPVLPYGQSWLDP